MNATFVEGVVENANSQQFGVFLPSFVILCIMLAIGIPGNGLALLVYWRKLQNGIARGLFITLCLGDLLSCVFVTPFELYIMTHFFNYADERSCKLLRLFSYCVNNITSFVILSIAVERHRVICKPWKQMRSSSAIRRICIVIFVASFLLAMPMYFAYGTQTVPLFLPPSDTGNVTDYSAFNDISKYKVT